MNECVQVLEDFAKRTNPVLKLNLEVSLVPESNLLKVSRRVIVLRLVFCHKQVYVVGPRQAVLNKEVNYVHQGDQVAYFRRFVHLKLAVTCKHQVSSKS